ncbi:DnaJ domain-containing protein [Shewanella submarina]|nr:DNA-J related domain-containing protein [Shewanella submarina]MCL1036109.1 DnaJ domain-containing protein [Shewanella submarina]
MGITESVLFFPVAEWREQMPPTPNSLATTRQSTGCRNGQDNPLIWPLLSLLQSSQQSWKVHHLAVALKEQGLLDDLDESPDKDLFKRNFLLMNALYELQEMLLPQQWLQVQAMEIRLMTAPPGDMELELARDIALREYYFNWDNYDTCANVVREMLQSFWNRYQDYIGMGQEPGMHKVKAMQILGLEVGASPRDVRRQWKKLALKWHPDRPKGDAARFRLICEAWHTLRGHNDQPMEPEVHT